MDKDYLTLKHAPIGPNEEDYDVLFDSVLVGRVVLSPAAPKDRQWMWSLDHRDRSPTRGYEPTREAAMAAFAKSCGAGASANFANYFSRSIAIVRTAHPARNHKPW
jgi:hypothetical protein